MKNVVLILGVLVVLGLVGYFLLGSSSQTVEAPTAVETDTSESAPSIVAGDPQSTESTTTETQEPETVAVSEIGTSVSGRPISVHTFGTGENDVLVVGGIHGAFAPNTTAVAERLITHVETNPNFVPAGVKLHIIPTLNPDGAATGESPAGRFNANGVDLNRNFDCEWQAEGVWRSQAVSGGAEPFSEPEAAALRSYVAAIDPAAAVVYYSAGGGVYASNCRTGVSAETLDLTDTYAQASDYDAFPEFDFYDITGDAVNWMAGQGISAISVLLSDYTSTQWEQNRAGLAAVLELYAE